MKGIILAGGLGTRLLPLTKVTNKHLLPVYDKPMIYYPIQKLVDAGITEIMIVTGGNSAGDFLKLLGNGSAFGLPDLYYTYQEGEGGIADALRLCEHFADGDDICVILGDNLFEDDLTHHLKQYRKAKTRGAQILLAQVEDPSRFGVPTFDKPLMMIDQKVIKITEKPEKPDSNYAVAGIYFYDSTVFDRIKTLKPSKRNELEITDVNNSYLNDGQLTHSYMCGWWTDAGTIETLHYAGNLIEHTTKYDLIPKRPRKRTQRLKGKELRERMAEIVQETRDAGITTSPEITDQSPGVVLAKARETLRKLRIL